MIALTQEIRVRIKVLAFSVALLWGIQMLNLLSGYSFNSYGIIPREFIGLRGIIFSPFLHGSIEHLVMNTLPLTILGCILILRGVGSFLLVSLLIALISGLGVWLFGRDHTVHVGASGIIFGYFGFLIFKGVFDRRIGTLVISGVVTFLYGGMIWGVFPSRQDVSWEGHLFGFVGGVLCAYFSKSTVRH